MMKTTANSLNHDQRLIHSKTKHCTLYLIRIREGSNSPFFFKRPLISFLPDQSIFPSLEEYQCHVILSFHLLLTILGALLHRRRRGRSIEAQCQIVITAKLAYFMPDSSESGNPDISTSVCCSIGVFLCRRKSTSAQYPKLTKLETKYSAPCPFWISWMPSGALI